MNFYKRKIQKELRKALQSFQNNQKKSLKTHLIKKQGKIKRLFRPRNSYKQQLQTTSHPQQPHILNFYNILNINQKALIDQKYPESFLQTNFYAKTIKKIEVKQNYVVLFLKESGLSNTSVKEKVQKYINSQNMNMKKVGQLLFDLSQKLQFSKLQNDSDISLTAKAYELLDGFGDQLFVCKIFNEKVVISKKILYLMGYNIQEFVIESLKYKFPIFELLSSQNYPKILQTQIQFYSNLIDSLYSNLQFDYLSSESGTSFIDTINTKENIEYKCQMNLSMPIPLVQLLKVEQIIETVQKQNHNQSQLIDTDFRKFRQNIWEKQNKMLQHLIDLPFSFLPQNKSMVASFIQTSSHSVISSKVEEDESRSARIFHKQSSGTIQYPFNTLEYEHPFLSL